MGVVVPNPTVTEVDGTPSVSNVKTIKFSNGTVTASGRTATIVNSGGGGGGGSVDSVSGTAPVASTGGTTPVISLNDLGVTEGKIADDAVTSDKVADNAIVSDKIASNAIITDKINANAVTQPKMATDSVSTTNIVDGAVSAVKIGDDAVTSGKILDGAVVAGKLATNSIVAANIQSGQITNDKMGANSVKAVNIEDSSVTVAKLSSSSGTPSATTFYSGDGSWLTPSGGGGGSSDFDVKLVSTALDSDGSDYESFPIMMMAPYGTGNHVAATVAEKIAFFPFIAPVSGDISKMYYKLNTGSASEADVYLGFYSNGSGNIPTNRLGFITIDATVSGAGSSTSFSSTVTLARGTQYWLAVCKSASVSVSFAGCRGQNVPSIAPQSTIRETYVSQCIITTSAKTELPASLNETDLEPGFAFSGQMLAPNVGVEFS
jgi:hypothetical protein